MNKDNRTLKVYSTSQLCQRTDCYRTNYYKYVPQIRLQGIWLAELGFEEGKPINVQCDEEKLIITLMREEERA